MANNTLYVRTVVQYCRDFCSDAAEFIELESDNLAMADLIDSIIMNDSYSQQEILHLFSFIQKHLSVIIKLYSRYPESTFIEKMYHRGVSIRDMCESVLAD